MSDDFVTGDLVTNDGLLKAMTEFPGGLGSDNRCVGYFFNIDIGLVIGQTTDELLVLLNTGKFGWVFRGGIVAY